MPTLGISKKLKFCFRRKYIYFFKKRPKVWTFWEFLLFQLNSRPNLIPLEISGKIMFFLDKTSFFFKKKTQMSNVSTEFDYFRRILRQIATNSSKNNFTFGNVNVIADVAWTQLANIGKQTSEMAHLSGIFRFHFLPIRRKIKKKTWNLPTRSHFACFSQLKFLVKKWIKWIEKPVSQL